jgi:hypothetical protein
MVKDEPYDMMPHSQIAGLKKQLQNLKFQKSSSQELMNTMNVLAKSMDSMLRLFKEASEELKVEEKEDAINKKLNEIIEQNKVLAEGMVTVSDTVKDFVVKPSKPETMSAPQPSFHPAMPKPSFPPPNSDPVLNEELSELDKPSQPQKGPVAMPSIPFSNIDEPPKPKKKGLFGRFKK